MNTDRLIETIVVVAGWITFLGTAWHQDDPSGACAIRMHLAKNHEEHFTAVAKDVLGLQTANTMGTIDCEAMIQDSNITINQFSTVRRHVSWLHHK
jgi:hypothetical protein